MKYGGEVSVSMAPEFEKVFTGMKLVCFTKIAPLEYLICNENQMMYISQYKSPKTFQYCYIAIQYIPDLDLIIGISGGIPKVVVMANRHGYPVLGNDYRLPSPRFNRIIYIKSANLLVIGGDGIEILELKFEKKMFELNPDVRVIRKAGITGDSFLMDSGEIVVDELRAQIFAPLRKGYACYSFDGKIIKREPDVGGNAFRTVSVKNSGKFAKQARTAPFQMMLTSDSEGTVRVWNESKTVGIVIKNDGSSFSFAKLIDSEFAVLIDEANSVIILDLKTEKKITLTNLHSKPVSITFEIERGVPRLCALMGHSFGEYSIYIPWKMFARLSGAFISAQRWPMNGRTARIAIMDGNGVISLVPPWGGNALVSVGPSSKDPKAYIYDRGCIRVKDQLYTYGTEEHVLEFSQSEWVTVSSPSPMKSFVNNGRYNLGASNVTLVVMKNAQFFIGFLPRGDIVRFNYSNFQLENRVSLENGPPLTCLFDVIREHLYVVYREQMLIIDPSTLTIIEQEAFEFPVAIAGLNDDLMFLVAGESRLTVRNLDTHAQQTIVMNEGIKFATVQYATLCFVTESNKIHVYNSSSKSALFMCPFDISGVALLNSDLDLLIALDWEIMVIERQKWYPWVEPVVYCEADSDNSVLEPWSQLIKQREFSHKQRPPKKEEAHAKETSGEKTESVAESDPQSEPVPPQPNNTNVQPEKMQATEPDNIPVFTVESSLQDEKPLRVSKSTGTLSTNTSSTSGEARVPIDDFWVAKREAIQRRLCAESSSNEKIRPSPSLAPARPVVPLFGEGRTNTPSQTDKSAEKPVVASARNVRPIRTKPPSWEALLPELQPAIQKIVTARDVYPSKRKPVDRSLLALMPKRSDPRPLGSVGLSIIVKPSAKKRGRQ